MDKLKTNDLLDCPVCGNGKLKGTSKKKDKKERLSRKEEHYDRLIAEAQQRKAKYQDLEDKIRILHSNLQDQERAANHLQIDLRKQQIRYNKLKERHENVLSKFRLIIFRDSYRIRNERTIRQELTKQNSVSGDDILSVKTIMPPY